MAVLLVVLVDMFGQQTQPLKTAECESAVVASQELQSSALLAAELVSEDHIQQVEQSQPPAASPMAWIRAPTAAACEMDHAALAVLACCLATLKPGLVFPGDWQILQTEEVLDLGADAVAQNYQNQKQKVLQLSQRTSKYAAVNGIGRCPAGNKIPSQGHQVVGSLQDSEQMLVAD